VAALVDELTRCHRLGIRLFNFHPGARKKQSVEQSVAHVARGINLAHTETAEQSTVAALENTAGQGTCLGHDFAHLAGIIAQVHDKRRVGVCLDTCHLFSAGYDVSTPRAFDAVMLEFDRVVGLSYLRAMHLNDSKTKLDSRVDRHANFDTSSGSEAHDGHIGVPCFEYIMNDARFDGLPMIIETPSAAHADGGFLRTYTDEIAWLYSLEEPQQA
jgi:deoxyribonuclease-4